MEMKHPDIISAWFATAGIGPLLWVLLLVLTEPANLFQGNFSLHTVGVLCGLWVSFFVFGLLLSIPILLLLYVVHMLLGKTFPGLTLLAYWVFLCGELYLLWVDAKNLMGDTNDLLLFGLAYGLVGSFFIWYFPKESDFKLKEDFH